MYLRACSCVFVCVSVLVYKMNRKRHWTHSSGECQKHCYDLCSSTHTRKSGLDDSLSQRTFDIANEPTRCMCQMYSSEPKNSVECQCQQLATHRFDVRWSGLFLIRLRSVTSEWNGAGFHIDSRVKMRRFPLSSMILIHISFAPCPLKVP